MRSNSADMYALPVRSGFQPSTVRVNTSIAHYCRMGNGKRGVHGDVESGENGGHWGKGRVNGPNTVITAPGVRFRRFLR